MIPASISSTVFASSAGPRHPNTSPGRVAGNTARTDRSSTPSAVRSTTNCVPTPYCNWSRIALGRITCPFVETVVVSLPPAMPPSCQTQAGLPRRSAEMITRLSTD